MSGLLTKVLFRSGTDVVVVVVVRSGMTGLFRCGRTLVEGPSSVVTAVTEAGVVGSLELVVVESVVVDIVVEIVAAVVEVIVLVVAADDVADKVVVVEIVEVDAVVDVVGDGVLNIFPPSS